MGPHYYASTSSTSTAWECWVDNTTSTASSSVVWTKWASGASTTASVQSSHCHDSTTTVWTVWVDTSYAETLVYDQKTIEEARKREEKLRIEREKQAKERERKAYLFLMLCLNSFQKQQFEKNNYFDLEVVGGKKYRINKGQCRNIQELDKDGKKVRTLCFHPKDNLHDYDAMAIQKLALEADEAEALKVANFS